MPGRGCRQRHAAVLSGRQLGPAQRYRCRQLLKDRYERSSEQGGGFTPRDGQQAASVRAGSVTHPTRTCRIEGVAKFVYLCVGLYVNNGRSDPAFNIVIRIGGAPNAD